MKKYKEFFKIFAISLFVGMIAIGIGKLFEAKHTFMAIFGILLLQLVFIYIYSIALALVEKKMFESIKALSRQISTLECRIDQLHQEIFIEHVEEFSHSEEQEKLNIN